MKRADPLLNFVPANIPDSDGQLVAVDLKWCGPISSERLFDTADEETEKWCGHFDEITRSIATCSRRARSKKSLGRKRSMFMTGHPEPKRRRDEYPLFQLDGSRWTTLTQVDQTSDVGCLVRNSRRRPRTCRWHMNFSARCREMVRSWRKQFLTSPEHTSLHLWTEKLV